MTHVHLDPTPRTLLAGKAERLVTHCVYQIATGKWAGGARLPSVREAEVAWGLDRRTVMKAYHHLQSLGLVVARTRSGFYVTEGPEVGRLARHRHELEALFERCAEMVAEETDLSLQGVFRYFSELAVIRSRERPECAFVECTATQARGHARELETRLGVPCLGLTLAEIDGKASRVPRYLRTLFVSGFHLGELAPTARGSSLQVHAVPIEVSPAVVGEDPGEARGAVLLESDAVEAEAILEDVRVLGFGLPVEARVVEDVESTVAELAADARLLVLLSPRLWGRVGPGVSERPNVRQVVFRIAEEAWPRIADALGLPLGALAG